MNTTTFIDAVGREVTVEQADALIERIGMTEEVEDYELVPELGHVYQTKDGSRLVVDEPMYFSYYAPDDETIAPTSPSSKH